MIPSVVNKLFFLFSILAFFVTAEPISMKIIGIGLVVSICLMIIKSIKYKNSLYFVFSLFLLPYCVAPLGYLMGLDKHVIDNVTFVETTSSVFLSTNCLLLFLTSFLLVAHFDVPLKERQCASFLSLKNTQAYTLCIIVAMLCIIFGLSGSTIFESGGYGNGGYEKSSIYEYGIIFIGLALIYSSSKIHRKIVYLICIFFILKDLIYGGRIASVELVLTVFAIRFLNSFSFKQIFITVILGYIFFQFWGFFRSGVSSTGFDIKEADGNAQYVVYASMRIHYMIEHGILTSTDRIVSFVSFLLSSFVPFDYLPDLANLSQYKSSEYYTGGGGLVSTFFYCWAWIPGIIAVAVWIGKSVNKLFHSESIYWKFYGILILTTAPRWFAYYPTQIFKYAVYGALLFFFINKLSYKNSH